MNDPKAAGVLCIDLDGTLIRSDLLLESLLKALRYRFGGALWAMVGLLRGKACLKRRMAELVDLRVDLLPYNRAVLERIEVARNAGQSVVLVTAADQKYAQAVSDYLGVFDAVHASDGRSNLSARTKAERLVDLFGEEGFIYAGDSRKDLEIWRHAKGAIVVDPQPGVIAGLERLGLTPERLSSHRVTLSSVGRALRPHQWLKNFLVFLPLLTAHRFADLDAILATTLGFVSFSLMASAGYLINDLLDLEADRDHPRKRRRPFAAGDLPIQLGMALVPILVVFGAATAFFLPPTFLGILVGYFLISLAYSLYLKARSTIDVLVLAGLYTLRVLGGTAAIGLPPSFWLLAFCMFLFLSLAYAKRYAELHNLNLRGRIHATGRGYGAEDLPLVRSLGISAGYGAVLVLALYIDSPAVRELYRRPEGIWAICPILLYWTARLWTLAHRGRMHDDPLIFTISDRISQLAILISAVIIGLSI